jgi:MFS family permease
MAVYPIAFLLTAPFIGGHMGNFGRKNSVLAGVILMTLATLMFGMASYASSEFWFFTVSFIGRTLQGIADAIIGVSIPSIIALEFPDK